MTTPQKIADIKEEEIRPDDLFQEFVRLSVEDTESFFDKTQFVEIACPACGSKHSAEAFVKHSFQYQACADCGSIYVSPRPNEAELLRYYAQSDSQKFWVETILKQTGEKRAQSIMLPNIERVSGIVEEQNKQPKSILDVGASNGMFLEAWGKNHPSMKLMAIEPGEDAANKCRAKDIDVFENFVEDMDVRQNAEADLVTCFEVIEHVQNPQNFASAMYDITAQDGMAVMSCLGVDGFDIQVLWEESRSIMPPYHLNFLSYKGMQALFQEAGFSKVEVFTPGRLDVEIVERAIQRGASPKLSRFEKLLLSRGEETLKAFQKFLADHALSSHTWIVCHK